MERRALYALLVANRFTHKRPSSDKSTVSNRSWGAVADRDTPPSIVMVSLEGEFREVFGKTSFVERSGHIKARAVFRFLRGPGLATVQHRYTYVHRARNVHVHIVAHAALLMSRLIR